MLVTEHVSLHSYSSKRVFIGFNVLRTGSPSELCVIVITLDLTMYQFCKAIKVNKINIEPYLSYSIYIGSQNSDCTASLDLVCVFYYIISYALKLISIATPLLFCQLTH